MFNISVHYKMKHEKLNNPFENGDRLIFGWFYRHNQAICFKELKII